MSIISKSPTIAHPKGSSSKLSTNVGSGSRPTASKIKIATSAPESPQTLGRATSGALKQG